MSMPKNFVTLVRTNQCGEKQTTNDREGPSPPMRLFRFILRAMVMLKVYNVFKCLMCKIKDTRFKHNFLRCILDFDQTF